MFDTLSGMATFAELQRPDRQMPAALPLNVSNVRTFDTPEFAGMTFLEVEAKSALNKVKGMMFPWSINPYRGCSHACSYCCWGGTPVLLADGRTKPIAQLRVGEKIFGTIQTGRYRRCVVTQVLDHWQTVKAAYRVTLADGTILITSGDHRFLSERGWKHVTGAEHGQFQRSHLTTNSRLIGTGAFAEPPKGTAGYRRGYLCGMIRGDASLRWGEHRTPQAKVYTQFQFRLALTDVEGLERTADFLSEFGIATRRFDFSAGIPYRRPLEAIVSAGRSAVNGIRALVAWPSSPDEEWHRGFLAGIFDAEGDYNQGVLRISNNHERVLQQVCQSLAFLGFADFTVERHPERCTTVRVRGGLREHLRFFHMTDPAIRRKCSIDQRAVTGPADLKVVSIEPLGFEMPLYDITTGTGDFIANGVISHNCFARPTHAYLNLSPLGDFEKTVVVKTNVVEVLRRELARPSWKGEHVAMGTNTDPYQRCEGRYKLMPGIIEALAEGITPFSILTKGTLITRDLALLAKAAAHVPVSAAMTIGMLDEALWRSSEPGTPSPSARLSAVRALNDAGVATGIMLAPIMPGLNDDEEQLADLVDRCAQAGATHITPIVLHLRPGVREVFWPWLQEHHPELVGWYERLYRRSNASDEYRDPVIKFVEARRKDAWRRYGQPPPPPTRPLSRSEAGLTRPGRNDDRSGGGEQLQLL